jgi:hypothetical protein
MEERGGEEEGAAQGRSGRAGRGRARPHGARGARPSLPGRGARGRWSTGAVAGHRRHRRGEGKGRRRRGETEGGEVPPPGKVSGEWERLCTDGKTKKQETLGATIEVSHRGRRPSPEPRGNPSIAGDSGIQSTNRTRCDEALDETNAAVPLDSADDARIGSNCSPELSPELEPPRTSAGNTGS